MGNGNLFQLDYIVTLLIVLPFWYINLYPCKGI